MCLQEGEKVIFKTRRQLSFLFVVQFTQAPFPLSLSPTLSLTLLSLDEPTDVFKLCVCLSPPRFLLACIFFFIIHKF